MIRVLPQRAAAAVAAKERPQLNCRRSQRQRRGEASEIPGEFFELVSRVSNP
jgi:hypothetical protein